MLTKPATVQTTEHLKDEWSRVGLDMWSRTQTGMQEKPAAHGDLHTFHNFSMKFLE